MVNFNSIVNIVCNCETESLFILCMRLLNVFANLVQMMMKLHRMR